MTAADRQGEWWSADAEGWAARAEPHLRPLHEAVLDRLPAAGTLLDAGCGAGALAALAVRRGHRVAGLDAAPALVDHARATVPEGDFRVGDLERLPFRDGAFDAVAAVNSVLYATRPERAVAELRRVTAPGGRVVVTAGSGEASAACAAGIEPLLPPEAHASSRTSLSLEDREATRIMLAAAGLELTAHDRIEHDVVYADRQAAVAAQLPAGPVQAAIAHAGRAAVTDALDRFFATLAGPDGSVAMPTAFVAVVAAR